MLNSLQLKNFKSWRDTGSIEFGSTITGVFGTNSSGKTSLLQALLMLKQTATSPDRSQVLHLGDDRSLVNLGTFRDVAFGHATTTPVEWSIRWETPKPIKVVDPEREGGTLFDDRAIAYSAALAESAEGKPSVGKLEYRLGPVSFVMEPKSASNGGYRLSSSGGNFRFKRTPGRVWDLPQPVKCYGFPDQVRGYYQNAGFLSDLELALEAFLDSIHYLGPLRDYPRREYTWAGDRPVDMGQRGEKVVHALLASRDKRSPRGRGVKSLTVEESVARWLQRLGLIDTFSVEPIASNSNLYRVWVQRHEQAAKVLITDVGFGISQILPVLTLCYYVPKGSIVILEQPEIHLHPSVQAGLADVLIDAARTNAIQIIVESHSEHLLRRLQLRMAEGRANVSDIALYFAKAENGESTLSRLDLDMFGRIQNWPKDFFGNEFHEMAEMTRAIARRRTE